MNPKNRHRRIPVRDPDDDSVTDTSDHHFATFRGSRMNAYGNPSYER